MKKAFTIFIGFLHDFAAGCWAAAMFAIYWLNRQAVPPESSDVILGLKKQFFYFGIVCVLIVFATGAGRTFTYANNLYGENAEKMRRKMLILKHIVLFSVFGLGLYWGWTTVFR
ncbi:MAG: hypothetical protein A2X59_06480 [Nitrospirae bacterium GWC2_42_7]|nr:MAG: hypothetical protein A2X59_06480 [Nitrospirae bacterium GWC2_42_7]